MSFLSSSQKALVDRIGTVVDDVEARMMLGTVGLFSEDEQFGILEDQTLYLCVDEAQRSAFVEAGTEPYSAADVENATYLAVPSVIANDDEAFAACVERAAEAAG